MITFFCIQLSLLVPGQLLVAAQLADHVEIPTGLQFAKRWLADPSASKVSLLVFAGSLKERPDLRKQYLKSSSKRAMDVRDIDLGMSLELIKLRDGLRSELSTQYGAKIAENILGTIQKEKAETVGVSPVTRLYTNSRISANQAASIVDRFIMFARSPSYSVGVTFNSGAAWTNWKKLCDQAWGDKHLDELRIGWDKSPVKHLTEIYLKKTHTGSVKATFSGTKTAILATIGTKGSQLKGWVLTGHPGVGLFESDMSFDSISDANSFIQSHVIVSSEAHFEMYELPQMPTTEAK